MWATFTGYQFIGNAGQDKRAFNWYEISACVCVYLCCLFVRLNYHWQRARKMGTSSFHPLTHTHTRTHHIVFNFFFHFASFFVRGILVHLLCKLVMCCCKLHTAKPDDEIRYCCCLLRWFEKERTCACAHNSWEFVAQFDWRATEFCE